MRFNFPWLQEISFPFTVNPFRKDGILHKLHTIRTGVLIIYFEESQATRTKKNIKL